MTFLFQLFDMQCCLSDPSRLAVVMMGSLAVLIGGSTCADMTDSLSTDTLDEPN